MRHRGAPLAMGILAISLCTFLSSCGHLAPSERGEGDWGEIERAFRTLLAYTPPGELGGFVVFETGAELDYVQYSLDEAGFLLNWPTLQPGGRERLSRFVEVLTRRGFALRRDISPEGVDRQAILSLSPGQMVVASDGLYAQCGRDAEELSELTRILFEKVFGPVDPQDVKVTLAPDG